MSFILSVALAATCQQYSVQCQCGPAVPFEGFQIYLVENCDGKESWETSYGLRQFTTMEDCEREGIPAEPACQNLPKNSKEGGSPSRGF